MRYAALVLFASLCAVLCAAQPEWHRLEGMANAEKLHMSVWQMTDGGAVIQLRNAPDASGNLEMFVLNSPDFALAPGERVGLLKRTVQPGIYDVALVERVRKAKKGAAARMRSTFTAEFTAEGRMILKPYKKSWSVNVFRLLPYLFRVSVQRTDTRPDNLEGAVRLSPDPYYPTTAL